MYTNWRTLVVCFTLLLAPSIAFSDEIGAGWSANNQVSIHYAWNRETVPVTMSYTIVDSAFIPTMGLKLTGQSDIHVGMVFGKYADNIVGVSTTVWKGFGTHISLVVDHAPHIKWTSTRMQIAFDWGD